MVTGLGFWRYSQTRQNFPAPAKINQPAEVTEPVEVPKTLPVLNPIPALVPQVIPSKSPAPQITSSDSKIADLEASLTELKARVSALEKATPVSSSTQASVYIPLGSGGGPWADKEWYSTEYEVSLDPANYPGYKGMVLEVSFRLVEAAGTASVRLYNVTDSGLTSSQLDTTSTSFSLKTSTSFTLPAGAKTYKLQVKSSQGTNLYIQSARIKVNF